MQLKKYELKSYVSKEIYQRVRQEATTRHTTHAKVIRDSLTEYFLLREELANAIEAPGNMGENHTGKIIHTLLARSEERFMLTIGNLEKQLTTTQAQLRLMITMIDQFYLDLMQYLPNIPEQLRVSIITVAKLRHQEWLRNVEKVISN